MWFLWLVCCPLILCDAFFSSESITYLRNESDAGFGRAVTLLFDQVVVCSFGAAHIFSRSSSSLSLDPFQSLYPPAPSASFCSAAASSGQTLALADNVLERVYLYTRDAGGNWTLDATLSLPTIGDGFGAALEYGAGLLYVGAPLFNESGCVFAFRDAEPLYASAAVICPRNASGSRYPPSGALFGTSLSFNEFGGQQLLVVGAPGLNFVYLFERDEGDVFAEFGEDYGLLYTPKDMPEDAAFGAAVALDSFWLLVGAPSRLERRFYIDAGAVYVYRYVTENRRFELSQTIRRNPLELYAYFGAQVEIAGAAGVGLVSAPGNGGNAVYQLVLEDGEWRRRQAMGGLTTNTTYGFAIDMDYAGFVAGAPQDTHFRELNITESEGVVYSYSLHYQNSASLLESFLF